MSEDANDRKINAALALGRKRELAEVSKMLAGGRYGELKEWAADRERRARKWKNRTPAERDRAIADLLNARKTKAHPRPPIKKRGADFVVLDV